MLILQLDIFSLRRFCQNKVCRYLRASRPKQTQTNKISNSEIHLRKRHFPKAGEALITLTELFSPPVAPVAQSRRPPPPAARGGNRGALLQPAPVLPRPPRLLRRAPASRRRTACDWLLALPVSRGERVALRAAILIGHGGGGGGGARTRRGGESRWPRWRNGRRLSVS